uniref:uncharacterized protein LOC125907462 n=1 Tax=Anopheles coluzzii TaxID=1518534 RepID=UPI0020FFD743|nr:uncharacterized protein LOC125907462 [Anopheles coluzzii]
MPSRPGLLPKSKQKRSGTPCWPRSAIWGSNCARSSAGNVDNSSGQMLHRRSAVNCCGRRTTSAGPAHFRASRGNLVQGAIRKNSPKPALGRGEQGSPSGLPHVPRLPSPRAEKGRRRRCVAAAHPGGGGRSGHWPDHHRDGRGPHHQIGHAGQEEGCRAGIDARTGAYSGGSYHIHGRRDGTQRARVRLPRRDANFLLEKRIVVGHSVCLVRSAPKQQRSTVRCFRCLERGHTTTDCQGEDRSGLCLRCGAADHRAATCTKDPKCIVCGGPHRIAASIHPYMPLTTMLNVLQFNANHCENAQDLALHVMTTEGLDVLLLSEPYCVPCNNSNWVTDESNTVAIVVNGNQLPIQRIRLRRSSR